MEEEVKPLIIGEAPSKNEETPRPIEGRIGKRLANYAGISLYDFLAMFDRTNLLHVRQDTKEKGFEFDLPSARIAAATIMKALNDDDLVLLLGGRVAEAFGVHDNYFAKVKLGRAEAYILPHPSGVNRWHNDPENKAKMTAFMRKIVERIR